MITPTPATCRTRPFLLSETRVCDVACTTTPRPLLALRCAVVVRLALVPPVCPCTLACPRLACALTLSVSHSYTLYMLHARALRLITVPPSVRQSLPHYHLSVPLSTCFSACSLLRLLPPCCTCTFAFYSTVPTPPSVRPAPASSPSRTDSNHGLACVHTACFFSLSLSVSLCLLRSTASRYLHS